LVDNGTSWAMDANTVLYGVIGDPIRHSKSPVMMNSAFRELGLNGAYGAFHVKPEALEGAVKGMRVFGFRGLNVTIPHKVEVMGYLDEIDEGARVIGAVNTIVNENGVLKGYNTDGIGYVRSLKEETGISLQGARVLVLGAGGAARGVAYALAKEGVSRIMICNRSKDKAVELAETISEFTEASAVGMDELSTYISSVDILLNTTSVGMHPSVDETPIDPALLHEKLLVSDLIYNPRITRLLHEAKQRGARIHGGLGMFIYQGAYALEYWTGLTAPAAAMREVVEQSLKQN
jgi:shikimate dehydrogenase